MGNVQSGGTDEFARQVNSMAMRMSQEGSIPFTTLQPLVAVLKSVGENVRKLEETFSRLEIQVAGLKEQQLVTDRRVALQGQSLQKALQAFGLHGPGEDSGEDTEEEEEAAAARICVLKEEMPGAVAGGERTKAAEVQKSKKMGPSGRIQTALAVPATTELETNNSSTTDVTVWNGWTELGKFFNEIKKGLQPESVAGQSLFKAASAGRVSELRALLDAGVDPNIKTWTGTALCQAVSAGHLPCVSLLLSRGAHPDIPDCMGSQPLHKAASRGDVACMHELMGHGASLEAKDFIGRTALHLAASGGHEEAVKAILRQGAEIDVVSMSGETPLHSAVVNGKARAVKALLEAGAKGTDKDGKPLFFYASSDEVKWLLKTYRQTYQVITK